MQAVMELGIQKARVQRLRDALIDVVLKSAIDTFL